MEKIGKYYHIRIVYCLKCRSAFKVGDFEELPKKCPDCGNGDKDYSTGYPSHWCSDTSLKVVKNENSGDRADKKG